MFWNNIFYYTESIPYSMTRWSIYSTCPWSGMTICVCGSASFNDPTALPPNDDRWMIVKRFVKWGLTPDTFKYLEKVLSLGCLSLQKLRDRFWGPHPATSLISSRGSSPGPKPAEAWSWPLTSISFWGYGSVQMCVHFPVSSWRAQGQLYQLHTV